MRGAADVRQCNRSAPQLPTARRHSRPRRPLKRDVEDGVAELFELRRRDRQRGRDVDHIRERADEDACVDEPLPQPVEVVQSLDLNHADGPFHPHVDDAGELVVPVRMPTEVATRSRRPAPDEAPSRTDQGTHWRPHRRADWPCTSGRASRRAMDRRRGNARTRASVATAAAIPIVPPVSALPRQTTSGTMPACSTANIVPVRPNPVASSSQISSTL